MVNIQLSKLISVTLFLMYCKLIFNSMRDRHVLCYFLYVLTFLYNKQL